MNYLVISTLPRNHEENGKLLRSFVEKGILTTIIYGEDYRIEGCRGCTFCWLKTPGKCIIRDDYEQIFKEILKADVILFITEGKLGFVSYKLKNMLDRIIPIVQPYLEIRDGECRHVPRYEGCKYLGLLYTGENNDEFLSTWLACVTKNFKGKSLGAYQVGEKEALLDAINNI